MTVKLWRTPVQEGRFYRRHIGDRTISQFARDLYPAATPTQRVDTQRRIRRLMELAHKEDRIAAATLLFTPVIDRLLLAAGTRGMTLRQICSGASLAITDVWPELDMLIDSGLLRDEGDLWRLTARGLAMRHVARRRQRRANRCA